MNLFEKDPCFLCINTTGLNKNKNHIFLINIKYQNKVYSLFSEKKESEKQIIEKALSLLSNRNIITYNGTSFDIDFLNRKSFRYGFGTYLESCFDMYRFLKRYYKFQSQSLKLAELLRIYCTITYPDQRQLISDYKNSEKEQDFFLQIGDKEISAHETLYLKIQDVIIQSALQIQLYEKIFRISFYRYTRNKSKLKLHFINIDHLSIMYISDFFEIYTDYNYFYIETMLREGRDEKQNIIYYIECPFDTEYTQNILPVFIGCQGIINHIIKYANQILSFVHI